MTCRNQGTVDMKAPRLGELKVRSWRRSGSFWSAHREQNDALFRPDRGSCGLRSIRNAEAGQSEHGVAANFGLVAPSVSGRPYVSRGGTRSTAPPSITSTARQFCRSRACWAAEVTVVRRTADAIKKTRRGQTASPIWPCSPRGRGAPRSSPRCWRTRRGPIARSRTCRQGPQARGHSSLLAPPEQLSWLGSR